MKTLILTLTLATCALLLGCGSASDADAPRTSSLEDRVERYAQAFEQREWLVAYSLNSPDFQARCPAPEYAVSINTGLAMLGAGTDSVLRVDVHDVREEGDLGYMRLTVFIDDVEIVAQDVEGPSWRRVDGAWYFMNTESTGEGCD